MARVEKSRIDQLLVERKLADSLQQAQAFIMAGIVYSNTQKITKAGEMIARDAALQLKQRKDHPYVSRGGLKLAHALSTFDINPNHLIALDIGSSTGGFTDVLLRAGAAKVYAVDVGYGELDYRLRHNPKVVVCERTHARDVSVDIVPDPIDILVCDVSFIRLQHALPVPMQRVKPGGMMVVLIKPQFQLPKTMIGEGGIVTDHTAHQMACDEVVDWLGQQPDWTIQSIIESPILGGDGNKEFLLWAVKTSHTTNNH